MKVTIVLDGRKRMKFHRRREQASGKQKEARSSTVAGASTGTGRGGWRYWVLVHVLMYKFGMRRYHVPCRPHIVRRSTYVGPNGPTDRSVLGGLTDRPTDRPIKKLTSVYNPTIFPEDKQKKVAAECCELPAAAAGGRVYRMSCDYDN